MIAHYFGSKSKGFTLIITRTPGLSDIVREIPVSGKAEAHKLAKELNAKPWNF